MRVAVIQMTSTEDEVKNDLLAISLIERAVKKRGAKFVCLPECFHCLGRDSRETQEIARRTYDSCILKFQNLAKRLGVWLSLGGIHRLNVGETKMSNCHIIISDKGKISCEYEKVTYTAPIIETPSQPTTTNPFRYISLMLIYQDVFD